MTNNTSNHSITQQLTGISTRHLLVDSTLTMALGNNTFAAMFVQQLHYWIEKGKGFFYMKQRWIWNSHKDWMDESNFPFLTPGQLRKAIDYARKLGVVKSEFLHAEHIGHNCDAWNRRLYYTIDYDRLKTILENHLRSSTKGSVRENITICSSEQDNTKNTSKENFQRNHHTQKRVRENEYNYSKTKERKPLTKNNVNRSSPKDVEHELVINSNLNEEKLSAPVVPKKDKEIRTPVLKQKIPDTPWQSKKELTSFYRDLVTALPNLGAKSAEAVAAKIIQDLKNGLPCGYWDDWKAGRAIGTSTMPEWEISPGVVAPKFIEYLKEKLRDAHDSNEKALERAIRVVGDKTKASLFWGEFKRSVEVLRQDNEKAVAEGRQPYIPVWFSDRAEITLDRAADSASYLNEVNPTSDWVENNCKRLNGVYDSFNADLDNCIYALKEFVEKKSKLAQAKSIVNIAMSNANTKQKKARLRKAIADIDPDLVDRFI